MQTNTDIDIDMADRDKALSIIQHVIARQKDGTKHKTSVYFQNIPSDPMTNIATLNSDDASELGYFKIDLLNNSIYKDVKNEEHLIRLIFEEPLWELLKEKDIVDKLQHIHDHFNIVNTIKPTNIHDLAIIIALIRPGKRHLFRMPRKIIDREIWKPVENGYTFKKSHAYAYALSIIVQLNLLVEENE